MHTAILVACFIFITDAVLRSNVKSVCLRYPYKSKCRCRDVFNCIEIQLERFDYVNDLTPDNGHVCFFFSAKVI